MARRKAGMGNRVGGKGDTPCLDSTVMGMPGSLSLMNGPHSLSMPSRARRRFFVHTFPWTRSLSSYRGKRVKSVWLPMGQPLLLPSLPASKPGPSLHLSIFPRDSQAQAASLAPNYLCHLGTLYHGLLPQFSHQHTGDNGGAGLLGLVRMNLYNT